MPGTNFWGDLLKSLRLEQGITQRRLAADTGVNRNTLGNIERGSYSGDIQTMETLLSHLGYELEAILVKTKKKPPAKTTCHRAAQV